MTTLVVARWTVTEAVSRRLVLAAILLSVAFVGLFALAFSILYPKAQAEPDAEGIAAVFAATLLTVLGLYAVQFLAAFLALLLSAGAISGEVESGTLHAVLARPLSRGQYLLGRWIASVALVSVYVVMMAGSLLLVARLVAGYQPVDPVRALALLVLETVLLLTAGLLGSSFLPTLANAVVLFSLFGLAWLAGIVEFIGQSVSNQTLANLGIAVSLVFPSDAIWRAASYYLQPPTFLGEAVTRGGIPFA
ncbi:MAG TPA: ABC transporter permease subunit, partial [Actinomycetota bacterium]|nr:ABC transporter permease subunit [Actinomycetota bacterium]